MKRYIIISLFLTIVCATINAQLPNTFFGATLGKTTKHQAIQSLLAQKAHVTVNGEDYLLVKNVTFDGIQYKNMTMNFYDDILYYVDFNDGNEFSSSKSSQLKEKYTSRYSSFRYYFYEKAAIFDDDVTRLTVGSEFVLFRDMKTEKLEKQDTKKLYREIHPYSSTRISQTMLGCTLGVSTKQQVINAMKSSGCNKLPFNNVDGSDQLLFSGTNVGGVSFTHIIATFTEGKLLSLLFFKYQESISQYELNMLSQHFSSMYSAYDRTKDPGGSTDGYIYDDDRISIAFSANGMLCSDIALKEKDSRRKERNLRGKAEMAGISQNGQSQNIQSQSIQTTDLTAFMLHGNVKEVTYYSGRSFTRCTFNRQGVLTKYETGDNHSSSFYEITHDGNKLGLIMPDTFGSWGEVYEVSGNRLVSYESGGDGVSDLTKYSNYDSNNCPQKESNYEYDMMNDKYILKSTSSYRYRSHDKYGNWTEKIDQSGDPVEMREIKYYE